MNCVNPYLHAATDRRLSSLFLLSSPVSFPHTFYKSAKDYNIQYHVPCYVQSQSYHNIFYSWLHRYPSQCRVVFTVICIPLELIYAAKSPQKPCILPFDFSF